MRVSVHFVRQPELTRSELERVEMLCGVRLPQPERLGLITRLDTAHYALCAECATFMAYRVEADRAARARVNLPLVAPVPEAVWAPRRAAVGPAVGAMGAAVPAEDAHQQRVRSWYQWFVKSRPRPRTL
jgi:hypothetical protein